MIRTLYHGSPKIVRTPKFGSGGAWNDFGHGFYCTDSPELASQWAVLHGRDGFVNIYKMDDTGLRILDLGSPSYCTMHWLSILLGYREFDTLNSRAYQAKDYIRTAFEVDHQNYDCIIGLRADNVNFMFAQAFINGEISYSQLQKAIRIGGSGRQIVLRSNRAFDRMLFNGYETVRNAEAYPAGIGREHKALSDVEKMLSAGTSIQSKPAGTVKAELYITQIMDENMREYDPRLR